MSDIILFDIDGTLFNAEAFGQATRQEFIKILNSPEEKLASAIADYYSELEDGSDFNARNITAFLSSRFGVDQALLDVVFWEDDEIFKKALFAEAESVLEKLSKTNTLGIFSQGFEELQARKIRASGLWQYFTSQYMFFHRRKTTDEAIALLPQGATVVDDNRRVVELIAPKVEAIWMNRKTREKDSQVKTIHSLLELI